MMHQKRNHHVAQLCNQARQALEISLICDCDDPELQDLQVLVVEQAPRSSALVVTCSSKARDLVEIERRLARASGIFRAAVAREITRKRVPSLRFRVVPELVE